MNSFKALPREILENICWELDDVSSLRSMRLVCKDLSVMATRPLFYEFTLYPNTESFDRLESVAGHEIYGRYVHCLTYSANMLRFFQDWHDDFQSWSLDAVGLGLGLTHQARESFRDQFSGEQLERAHTEWQRVTASQGDLIAEVLREDGTSSNVSRYNDIEQTAEVQRLKNCLGQLPKIKSIRWLCQTNPLNDDLALELPAWVNEVPQLESLPRFVQQTLMARDPYGSKNRHAKQVCALFGALHLAQGIGPGTRHLESLDIHGLNIRKFLELDRRDSEHDWMRTSLTNLKHLSITLNMYAAPQSTEAPHDGHVRAFEKLLEAASNLESLRFIAKGAIWPEDMKIILSPALKRLELSGIITTIAMWDKLFTKFATLEDISLSCLHMDEILDINHEGSYKHHPWVSRVASLFESPAVETVTISGTLSFQLAWNEVDGDDENDDENDEDYEDENDEDESGGDEENDGDMDEKALIDDGTDEQGDRSVVHATWPRVFDPSEPSRSCELFVAALARQGWALQRYRSREPSDTGLVYTRTNAS